MKSSPTSPASSQELATQLSTQALQQEPAAERLKCYACFRPIAHCYCDLLPKIQNRTPLVIVQHPRERFHPFGTARMLALGLARSRIVIDHNGQLQKPGALEFPPGAMLLYPDDDAPDLRMLSPDERPAELVIIDGTWHHAHTLFRDIPALRRLPRVRLTPDAPSRYRIRAEPRAECLSSLEATVEALKVIEPETVGLDQLVTAFERIIDRQIEWLQKPQNTRHRKRARPAHLRSFPRALLEAPENLVVVYGDSLPTGVGNERQPLHWVAQRFDTGELFERFVTPPLALPAERLSLHLEHMQLSHALLRDAVDIATFVKDWRNFARDTDVVIAHNKSSLDLLTRLGVGPARTVVLKAVYFNLGRHGGSLDEVVAHEKLTVTPARVQGRAATRVANARALSEFLRRCQM